MPSATPAAWLRTDLEVWRVEIDRDLGRFLEGLWMVPPASASTAR